MTDKAQWLLSSFLPHYAYGMSDHTTFLLRMIALFWIAMFLGHSKLYFL